MLGFGGTFAIESPAPYSKVAKGLIRELGIDVASYPKYVKENLYRSFGLYPKIFFDQETFGTDRLVINPMTRISGEGMDSPAGGGDALERFPEGGAILSAGQGRLRTSGHGEEGLSARFELGREKSPPRPNELQHLLD